MATQIRSDMKEVESGGYQLSNADWKIEIDEEEEEEEWDVILNR